MPPSEFWAASLDEIMLLLDAWTPVKQFGRLTEHDVDAIMDSRAMWESKGFKLA